MVGLVIRKKFLESKWRKPQVNPSILAADFCNLGQQIRDAAAAGVEVIHIDVMDGRFVPNISVGLPIVESLRPLADELGLFLDVHLMIVEPERYVKPFADVGADLITVHVEASPHLHRTIQSIHELGLKAGVALNPSTPIHALEHVLHLVDLALIMTVNPGFGGQAFIPEMTGKTKALAAWIERESLKTIIEVDGGVKAHNIAEIAAAGAHWLVSGSGVFNQTARVAENIAALNQKIVRSTDRLV